MHYFCRVGHGPSSKSKILKKSELSASEKAVSDYTRTYGSLHTGHSPGHHSRVGMLRTGDVEGVRQSLGHWQSREPPAAPQEAGPSQAPRPPASVGRSLLCHSLTAGLVSGALRRAAEMAEAEQALYHQESQHRRQSFDVKVVSGSLRLTASPLCSGLACRTSSVVYETKSSGSLLPAANVFLGDSDPVRCQFACAPKR